VEILGYSIGQVLYYGVFGLASTVFFILTVWAWYKNRSSIPEQLRSAAGWNVLGYLFLFVAAYMACGIGAPPGGRLLSADVASRNFDWAAVAALLSKFFSLPGWACVFVGMRKLMKWNQVRD
jgi:hypothetical protein